MTTQYSPDENENESTLSLAEKCRRALMQSYGADFAVPKSVQQHQKTKKGSD